MPKAIHEAGRVELTAGGMERLLQRIQEDVQQVITAESPLPGASYRAPAVFTESGGSLRLDPPRPGRLTPPWQKRSVLCVKARIFFYDHVPILPDRRAALRMGRDRAKGRSGEEGFPLQHQDHQRNQSPPDQSSHAFCLPCRFPVFSGFFGFHGFSGFSRSFRSGPGPSRPPGPRLRQPGIRRSSGRGTKGRPSFPLPAFTG